MLDYCIYNRLDQIIPSTDTSNHKRIRLDYLSACQILKNYDYRVEMYPHIPAKLFEPLLQSIIYNCFSKFINSYDMYRQENYSSLTEINIPFPEILGHLVLNWPYESFILRNQIPSLDQPANIYQTEYSEFASQKPIFDQVDNMLTVFHIFCNRLIKFITQTIFNCTSTNSKGISCNLRRLDFSGLVNVGRYTSYLLSEDILEGISNSKIDTVGHTINIFAGTVDISERGKEFELLRNTIEQSLKPDVGISVYFKEISIMASIVSSTVDSPTGLYDILALGRCEYIELYGYGVNKMFAENLYRYLPGLVGISLPSTTRIDIESLDFLSKFKNLEQLSLKGNKINGLMNSVCNLSKGLKYLDLFNCGMHSQDFECLANSIHSNTLLQFNLIQNVIENDSDAVGFITLCQNLKHVKVLIIEDLSLDTLSSNSISKLVNTFIDCDSLEILSLKCNPFTLHKTDMIINGLARKKSLRYLSLTLPEVTYITLDRLNDGQFDDGDNDEDEENILEPNNFPNCDVECLQSLCKIFHEKVNKFRQSPIYISWT